MNKAQLPLHDLQRNEFTIGINRGHILLHSILISLFFYHRLLTLFQHDGGKQPQPSLLADLLLFTGELVLAFLWLFEQPSRWNPIHRTTHPDRLGPDDDSHLPPLDIFICTVDPEKEPTLEVMNTVISAMSLDYPIDKLHVYLSDDGGSHITLAAVKEAWAFATWWVPFCRKYGVECRCPMAYFGGGQDQTLLSCEEFIRDRLLLKEKYEMFKQRVEANALQNQQKNENKANHPPLIQVINENCIDSSIMNLNDTVVPLLVYVAREKRPFHAHHFKAGALNVLLRVSGLLSNSPIVLVLDCDMYCNDPTSAKRAMCFYLDLEISSSLGFVQFPQRFHNLSKHPMYDDDFRLAFKVFLPGMDGLGTGPIMCGTGFYLNRKALYTGCVFGKDPAELKNTFGPSNKFITTLCRQDCKPNGTKLQQLSGEAEFVATCLYEEETKWGNGVGFYYYSVVEDVFTGYHLHIRGWKSIFLDPKKAQFLGTSTTNLNEMLTQATRWTTGLMEVGISRFCPLFYSPSRLHLPLLHRCSCTWMNLYSMDFIPVWCFAIVPQICFLHGIPMYAKVSTSPLRLLAICILFSSLIKHIQEVLTTGGTIVSWWNEQMNWIMKMLTCHTFGCIDAFMKILGLKITSFVPTSKVVNEAQANRYHQGVHDFQATYMFLVPLGTAVILNLTCFVMGSVRATMVGNLDDMALQMVLSGFFVVMSKPVIEAMVVRSDKGRFPTLATLMSLLVCLMLSMLGSLILVN